MSDDTISKWMAGAASAECGAVYGAPNHGRPVPPPCTKPAGHENGPDSDWKRDFHSNGAFKWPVSDNEKAAPMNHDPFEAAHRLAPIPDTQHADTTDWVRHYAAQALAAWTAFHQAVGTIPPNPERGSRPDLGYLSALGIAATAAAVALTHAGPEAARMLWWLTPEQGALNGEWEEWIVDLLDEHGVNPADINPGYSARDFRSPTQASVADR